MGIHIPNPPIPIPVAGVIAHLREKIVRIYGARIETDILSNAPHRPLIKVLDRLHPPDEPLNVFTTNYDPVLEQAVRRMEALAVGQEATRLRRFFQRATRAMAATTFIRAASGWRTAGKPH